MLGFAELVRMLHEHNKNVIIVKEGDMPGNDRKNKRIDIWWGQKGENAGLILALAHLLSSSTRWRNAKIALKTIFSSADDQKDIEKGLSTFVEKGRLDVSAEAVRSDDSDLFSAIEKSSKDADFIFLGLRSPVPDESIEEYSGYLRNIFHDTKAIPSVAYVLASEDLDFKKIFLSP